MKNAHAFLIAVMAAVLSPAHADGGHGAGAPAAQPGPAAAWGKPGDPARVSRVIEVRMHDTMRFTPARIRVNRGETIRFVVKNEGTLKHEMVLGTASELRAHAALMRRFPEMAHDDPNAISVEPGQTGELIWHFGKAGTFDFACLVPGHFEAGMRGRLLVKRR